MALEHPELLPHFTGTNVVRVLSETFDYNSRISFGIKLGNGKRFAVRAPDGGDFASVKDQLMVWAKEHG